MRLGKKLRVAINPIPRVVAAELVQRYAALDGVDRQLQIARHRRMPQAVLTFEINGVNSDYNFSMNFGWDELIEILHRRRDAILNEIANLNGELPK